MAKKRNAISAGKKLKILNSFKQGLKKKEIMNSYKVSSSSLCRILNLYEIEQNNLKIVGTNLCRQRSTTTDHGLNVYVNKFITDCNTMSFPVSGKLIKSAAMKYAERNHINIFKASNGWLEKFQNRWNIKSKKI